MKIKRILEAQQIDMRKQKQQKNNKKKSNRGKDECLSFSDILELMNHRKYRKVKGRIRQIDR